MWQGRALAQGLPHADTKAMSTLLIQIAIAAGIFLAGVAGGIKWHAGQDAIKEVARQENQRAVERLRRQNTDTAATGHEGDKGRIRTEFVTITERAEKVVHVPVYSQTCIDENGLELLRRAAALTGAPSEDDAPK